MKAVLMAVFALTVAAATAAVEDEAVEAMGVAKSYRGAVNAALVMALEQHEGITVSASEIAAVSEKFTAVNSQETAEINDAIANSMKKWARGRIRSFEVLSVDEVNGSFNVTVVAHFPGKYEVGLPEGNRRRMVVADFRSETGDSISWRGKSESSAAWSRTLADKVNQVLTQTRKFTMLDRKFDREVSSELALLGEANVSPAEAVKLNQKLVTDYLVVGSVRFFPVAAPAVNPYTGKTLKAGPQPFCEVSYRVLLAPTGQLKWTDMVRIDASEIEAAGIEVFANLSAAAAAARIAEGMMENIFPFEVVAVSENGELIIGEGGKSLRVGDRFTVCAAGEEVMDSRTGEVLDRIETPVGDVEITRVTPKLSYAKILGGDASKMTRGARLRRVRPAKAAAPSPAPTTTLNAAAGGGVVTPF